jgi:hypothetical protein
MENASQRPAWTRWPRPVLVAELLEKEVYDTPAAGLTTPLKGG